LPITAQNSVEIAKGQVPAPLRTQSCMRHTTGEGLERDIGEVRSKRPSLQGITGIPKRLRNIWR